MPSCKAWDHPPTVLLLHHRPSLASNSAKLNSLVSNLGVNSRPRSRSRSLLHNNSRNRSNRIGLRRAKLVLRQLRPRLPKTKLIQLPRNLQIPRPTLLPRLLPLPLRAQRSKLHHHSLRHRHRNRSMAQRRAGTTHPLIFLLLALHRPNLPTSQLRQLLRRSQAQVCSSTTWRASKPSATFSRMKINLRS